MDNNRWEQIKNIFDEASKLGSNERASFLKDACLGDVGLLSEVEELLNSTLSD